MAEILLSLTIIGVVAAITLPSLTGNINERTWNTQRKALYARMSQAIALMPALNGYGTLVEGDENTSTVDTAAETFVTAGLSKVLKINNICDNEHLEDCGFSSTITDMNASKIYPFPTTLVGLNDMFNGSYVKPDTDIYEPGGTYSYSQTDTKAAAFETANGESIVIFYNPNCISDMGETVAHYSQPKMCANFVYDLNGTKGPNTVGKDIGFITAFYPSDSIVVAPIPLIRKAGASPQNNAGALCLNQDTESRVPNIDELTSLFVNKKLLGIIPGTYWGWSSSVISPETAWYLSFPTGRRLNFPRSRSLDVWCVKR